MKPSKKINRKTISEIGEFDLIKRILIRSQKYQSKNPGFKTEVTAGDDAFVARFPQKSSLVFTTDTILEGTHFDFNLMKTYFNMNNQFVFKKITQKNHSIGEKLFWYSLGYKAMAVNLSDLAAMGNIKPLFSLVTLGLNGDISVDFVDNFYDGMGYFLKKCGYFLAGGDIIRSDKSIVSIVIVGKSESAYIAKRNGAKIGDILMVSGPIGLSGAGLEVMKKQIKSVFGKKLVHSHLFPVPQLKAGKILVSKQIQASSMMDLSDDLMTSLEILSQESAVGFEIDLEKIPVHPDLEKISELLHCSPYRFILYGGEDYRLLFTVDSSKVSWVKKEIPSAIVLGKVKPESFGIQIKMNGHPFKTGDRRFKHF